MYHFSTTQNMTSSVQKYASTFQTGANRWKPQVADWPCSCTAVLDITPSGTKWQCSGDTDGTSEAWDRWQAQTLQTEPCCSLWPGRAWELNADSPHGPGPHTTQHQDYCRHSHCEPQMPLMVILVMSELSTVARSKKKEHLIPDSFNISNETLSEIHCKNTQPREIKPTNKLMSILSYFSI